MERTSKTALWAGRLSPIIDLHASPVGAFVDAPSDVAASSHHHHLNVIEIRDGRIVAGFHRHEKSGLWANLLGLPEDRVRLREMLMALEAKERLVELLNAYVDARQESVRVVFDLEQHAPEVAAIGSVDDALRFDAWARHIARGIEVAVSR